MKTARMRVSLDFLVLMCQQTETPRVMVVENPLPDDARIVGCKVVGEPTTLPVTLELTVQSEVFADIVEGDYIPLLPATQLQRVDETPPPIRPDIKRRYM